MKKKISNISGKQTNLMWMREAKKRDMFGVDKYGLRANGFLQYLHDARNDERSRIFEEFKEDGKRFLQGFAYRPPKPSRKGK